MWLNGNSSAVMALATCLTMLATVIIAWATFVNSRIVRLQKKIECANRMPILCFADERTADHRSLFVKNIGYGPALNIVRKVSQPGEILGGGPRKPLALGSIAPNERVFALVATQADSSSTPVLDDPNFHAILECDDVLGRSYEFVYASRSLLTPKQIRKRGMTVANADRV
jgi:hypothetical protein